MTDPATTTDASADPSAPLSLTRLRAAFARMLGKPESDGPRPDAGAATPEGIVEAVLFVGRAQDAPVAPEEIAAVIRDVDADEVDTLVDQLNQRYTEDGAALRIDRVEGGYRMRLAEGLERLADRMGGRVRSTRLSPAALECLAVIAYRQPLDGAEIDRLRGTPSAGPVRQLLKRGLVSCDAPDGDGEGPAKGGRFATTDRFLRMLELAGLEQLPRVEELDD